MRYTKWFLGVFTFCTMTLLIGSIAMADRVRDNSASFITDIKSNSRFIPYVNELGFTGCHRDDATGYGEDAMPQHGGSYRLTSCYSIKRKQVWYVLSNRGTVTTLLTIDKGDSIYSVQKFVVQVHYDMKSNVWTKDNLGINKTGTPPPSIADIDREYEETVKRQEAEKWNKPSPPPANNTPNLADELGKGIGKALGGILKGR